jgi:hypothetical protein
MLSIGAYASYTGKMVTFGYDKYLVNQDHRVKIKKTTLFILLR